MSNLCTLGAFCDRFNRRTGYPGETGGFNLCETCSEHSPRDVASLLYDYVDLSQIIARHVVHSESEIFRPKPESFPPLDMNVVTLRDDIEDVLCLAERAVRDAHRLPARNQRDVRGGYNVDQALRVVLPRLELLAGLAAVPDSDPVSSGAELLHTLRGLHKRAYKVLGRVDVTALPGACPACHVMRVLSRRDGADTVVCQSCGHAMTWDAYRQSVTLTVTKIMPIPARPTRNRPS